LEATGPADAVATWPDWDQFPETYATDTVDDNVPVDFTPHSGSTFPLGHNPVKYNATDVSGNKTADSFFDVFVKDTTPPTLSPVATPTLLGVPANQMVAVTISPNAHDIVDLANLNNSIIGVTSNQAITPGVDYVISGLNISLKDVAGRSYTITVQSADQSGNAATTSVTVTAAPLPLPPPRLRPS
jgi:hypothetical protein